MGHVKWRQILKIDHQFGSFEVGKKPGVVLLDLNDDLKIEDDTIIKRLY